MITPKTKVIINPDGVTYLTPLEGTTKVIRVMLTTSIPRIMACTEDIYGQTPMSLFLDEIEWYIKDAISRYNQQPFPKKNQHCVDFLIESLLQKETKNENRNEGCI